MTSSLLDALVRPKHVAVIGASDDAKKVGGRPLGFMQKHGFTGQIHPVNPVRDTVMGLKTVPDVRDIDAPVDHAYILVNSDAAVSAAEACADAGVKIVSVLADGFAEAGAEGAERQARLDAIARERGIRILGPNSMGVVDLHSRFVCTTNAAFASDDLPPGRWGVLSQSGSLIGTFLSRGLARGIHFSTLISTGNEGDLGVGEIGELLVDYNRIDGFILFLETIRRPDAIATFADRAAAAGKPIVAYKLGRSDIGQELSVSHTGAMVGMDAAVDAFFRQIGIHRVDLFDTMFELPALLTSRPKGKSKDRAKTVAVLTTTGGGGAMVVDRLGATGIEVVGASQSVRDGLKEKGVDLTAARLIDVTLAGANYETMHAVVSALLRSEDIGVLVVAIGSSAQFFPELAVHPIIDAVAELDGEGASVIAFPVPEALEAAKLLASKGIATARTPESCAEAAAQMLAPETKRQAPKIPENTGLAQRLSALGSGSIAEDAALGLVAELGIPVPQKTQFADGEEIRAVPIDFPVVAKLISEDLPHKTEAGAVRVGVSDFAELNRAVSEMKDSARAYAPDAHIQGVMVQEQISGVAEVLLGFTRDANVGPVITVGMGGVLAEIYKDISVETAPVDLRTAKDMVARIKGLAPARGYRGSARGDLDALAEAIVAFSNLAAFDAVQEAEINPVIVKEEGQGICAVDGLFVLGEEHD